MLERFTEKARRVIFFARYEASNYGCPCIESFHLLLGLVRENRGIVRKFGFSMSNVREIYERLHPERKPWISVSVETPLSPDSKLILKAAAAKADQLGNRHIGTEHLLLAMLSESAEIRDELGKFGLTEAALMPHVAELAKRENEARARREVDEPSRWLRSEYLNSMREYVGRSGIGYDLHRLEADRKLRIGGIDIEFDKGPVGHSDGDVLAHAICDALLGAAGFGDIGKHFPDTDPQWKGIDSLAFLKHVRELYEKDGLYISYIDAIVIAERPKLGPHFPAMREALAGALGIKQDQINLKAKTNEGVDAIGRGEAIAAHAIATIVG